MNIRRDEKKCNNCWKCVKDCTAGVWRNVDGVPTPVDIELCNLCSHCLAVCPKSAIEHDFLDAEQVRKIQKNLIDPEYYKEIVVTRRSVRHYKNKPVPREVVEDIIDLARFSPTASNSQNVAYTVVTDKELLQNTSKRIFNFGLKADRFLKKKHGQYLLKLFEKRETGASLLKYVKQIDYYKSLVEGGRDLILHHAPALILIHAPARSGFASDNCNIAGTNITNYAHALGLGTCYIGFLTMTLRYDRTMRSWFNIPGNHRVFASITIGYPTYAHTFTVSRNKPTVQWL